MVIFNPWNSGECRSTDLKVSGLLLSEDDSFVESSEEIDDYILSSQGVIWRGNHRQRLAMYWDYGQVRENEI